MIENLAFIDPLSEYLVSHKKLPEESLLWNLLESIPTNISIWESGKILYANSAFYNAIGVDSGNIDELMQLVEEDKYFSVHPDDLDLSSDELKKEITGSLGFHRELRMNSRIDSNYKWYNTYVVKGKDPKSKIVIEIDEDIHEKKLAEENLRIALQEKELLIKEIHHRVKNNFQVISSLLMLQSRKIKDKDMKLIFEESQSRIMSMAAIHEMLYKSDDLEHIDFRSSANELIGRLVELYDGRTNRVRFNIADNNIELSVDKAIPCSLIINELVSNSLKYAFSDYDNAEITIDLEKENGNFRLSIRDNGAGFPEGYEFDKPDTLGLMIVKTLVSQLSAKIELINKNGVEYIITFKE
ncbi:MAG: sensor histidine kinase [Ignavibacteria bacterium]|nr:sensor histidine kinase [Ignavibacteria bacterium]MCC7159723.1 sensor histidine kinase [Ignavibacteria bacterium]